VQGDADLRFSMMLVRRAIAAEEEAKQAVWLYPSIINPYMLWHDSDITSCHKISASMEHMCQTAFNQKLFHEFEKCVNF